MDGDFKTVHYKRKGRQKSSAGQSTGHPDCSVTDWCDGDFERAIRRVNEAKEELSSSDFFQSVSALLKESLATLDNPKIVKIVCFGLGRVSELSAPRYQLALLLLIKSVFKVETIACDPSFNSNDLQVLSQLEINILATNVEGKYNLLNCQGSVIFYLPHCPKQLMNNLLWSNWGVSLLSKCIIIGNSINAVIENNSRHSITTSACYLNCILPYALEFAIVNGFRLFDVFNDTSIHVFPKSKLQLLPIDFWNHCSEPEYFNSDVEFIKNTQNR